MAVTGANVTKLVDGLERERLVRRAHLPGDRRVVLAELTEEGESLLRHVMPPYLARLRALWCCVSIEERADLVHLLTKLRMGLDYTYSALADFRP